MDYERLSELLKDAELCPRLTEWEEIFLDGLRERVAQYAERTKLSPKQVTILERIEKKVYA